jgi:hypothetical protein
MKTSEDSNRSKKTFQLQDYFDELEKKIRHKIHVEAMTNEGRAELIRSTGVMDHELIDELVKLGIPADGLIALRLFPLVLVAWAENDVDEHERLAVMTEALKLGILEDTTAWIVLDAWLTRQPPGLGVDAWRRYTRDSFSKMSNVAADRLIELTRQQMTAVAKASGGHLGFGKVSKKEQILIDRLVEAMQRESNRRSS